MLYCAHDDVAQWIERVPPEHEVEGSSPSVIAYQKSQQSSTAKVSCKLQLTFTFYRPIRR